MGQVIGPIRFNPNRRGRQYRGEDRNFDTDSLMRVINGGSVQERVKNGDMVGYYGHWPRIRFGMNPTEGGIDSGKVVNLEPATRVKSIRAEPDGTIEYTIELLDTAPGKLTQRMYGSKAGGFSSAITAPKRGALRYVTDFFGFDYVNEPNMTENRGYALDSVMLPDMAVLDDVSQYNEMLDAMNRVFDGMQSDYERALESLQRLELENAELYSMLSRKTGLKRDDVNLDGVLQVDMIQRTLGRYANADAFHNALLAGIEEPKAKEDKEAKRTAADEFADRRFGAMR